MITLNHPGNVQQVVPFFKVSDMERSLAWYTDGLGFEIRNRWVVDGKVRWCLLGLEGASIMLQELPTEGRVGEGVSLFFFCRDAIALYHDFRSRGIDASEPQVGNGMWVTGMADPDGYRMEFESETDAPEDAKLSEVL